jgi:hypothetical protein
MNHYEKDEFFNGATGQRGNGAVYSPIRVLTLCSVNRMAVHLMLLLLAGTAVMSCEKDSYAEEPSGHEQALLQAVEADLQLEDLLFAEPSEEVIDGVLFIDGVSQAEEIVDFDLEGVSVVDGRLAFTDIDAFSSALVELAAHNEESVAAWSSRIGFTSLFTEFLRIEALPSAEEMASALQEHELYEDYFSITDEGILELTYHSGVLARMVDPDGLIQSDGYVGAFYSGLNVWVPTGHEKALIKVLKAKEIPDGDERFLVTDDRAFRLERNLVFFEDCPKIAGWSSPTHRINNPNNNRKIDVQHHWRPFTFPLGANRWDTDYRYEMYSTSRRGLLNRRYKTNHYHSLDITIGLFQNFGETLVGSNNISMSGTENNARQAWSQIFIPGYRNTSVEVIRANPIGLVETRSGNPNSGQTGTSASHRGMGGLFVRQQCD